MLTRMETIHGLRRFLASTTTADKWLSSPSYLEASCGGAPLSIVNRYIDQQQAEYERLTAR
jgi:REP element-mobilizing transposase RayT